MQPPVAAYLERLERVLALTRALRSAAAEGEWERAVAIEAERRPFLEALFPVPPEIPRARLQEALAQLLADDRELMALGARVKDELAADLTRLARGRQAVHAYSGADRR